MVNGLSPRAERIANGTWHTKPLKEPKVDPPKAIITKTEEPEEQED